MRKRILVAVISSILFESTVTVTAYSVTQQRQRQNQHVTFVPRTLRRSQRQGRQQQLPFATVSSNVEDTASASEVTTAKGNTVVAANEQYSFIQTELRGAAMKLHTKAQSPREGGVETSTVVAAEPYITTHMDYLMFLIDSQHVYKAMEEIVHQYDVLQPFRNTGLERVLPLEQDIEFIMNEYCNEDNNNRRPSVGTAGCEYAQLLRDVAAKSIPAFMCHYYNHYFAHTAGGRMIGKQMSSLLLNKKTLEFYKWDGDLNEMKDTVKQRIETMASEWTNDERQECVDATKDAFKGGGAMNSYLSGRGKKS